MSVKFSVWFFVNLLRLDFNEVELWDIAYIDYNLSICVCEKCPLCNAYKTFILTIRVIFISKET